MGKKIDTVKRRIIRIIKLTVKKAMNPYFSGSAAEVAFFLLMSLVPTMILLAQISNLFGVAMDVIEDLFDEYATGDIAQIIMPLLDYEPSSALSIALIVLAFWSGSKALFSLMRITNFAYSGGTSSKNPLTGYIKERFRAIITILIIIFTMMFTVNIVIFGRVILNGILTYLNEYLGGSYNVAEIWINIRWLIGFLLYFFMVASIYYLLPSLGYKYKQLITKNKWKSIRLILGVWLANSKKTMKLIFPGSIFASIGMLVATWIYSLYLNNIATSNFNILYGTMGAAVMLLLWFYILAYILILGIQINSIWEESKGISKTSE